MSVVQPDTDSILFILISYFVQVAVFTPVYFLGVAIVAIPFTMIVIVGNAPEIGGYVFLAYAGWSFLMGQVWALEDHNDNNSENDMSKITEWFLTVATVIYYNAMTLLVVLVALSAQRFGYPALATAVAFGIPITDLLLLKDYNSGIAHAWMGLAINAGEKATDIYDSIPAKEILVGVGTLALQLSAVKPQSYKLFYLPEFARGKTPRKSKSEDVKNRVFQ